jgi:hypothetical protein
MQGKRTRLNLSCKSILALQARLESDFKLNLFSSLPNVCLSVLWSKNQVAQARRFYNLDYPFNPSSILETSLWKSFLCVKIFTSSKIIFLKVRLRKHIVIS